MALVGYRENKQLSIICQIQGGKGQIKRRKEMVILKG
jgi:hypothetical protein